jgi:hypothetical protein
MRLEVVMKRNLSRGLVIAGLVLMVIGAVDPLEGSVVILGGSVLAAIGAFRSRTRYRLPVAAMVLIAVGVAALFGMSALGGVGGNSGRSIWWLLLCLPYAIGWILGLVGATRKLRELRPASATPSTSHPNA